MVQTKAFGYFISTYYFKKLKHDEGRVTLYKNYIFCMHKNIGVHSVEPDWLLYPPSFSQEVLDLVFITPMYVVLYTFMSYVLIPEIYIYISMYIIHCSFTLFTIFCELCTIVCIPQYILICIF